LQCRFTCRFCLVRMARRHTPAIRRPSCPYAPLRIRRMQSPVLSSCPCRGTLRCCRAMANPKTLLDFIPLIRRLGIALQEAPVSLSAAVRRERHSSQRPDGHQDSYTSRSGLPGASKPTCHNARHPVQPAFGCAPARLNHAGDVPGNVQPNGRPPFSQIACTPETSIWRRLSRLRCSPRAIAFALSDWIPLPADLHGTQSVGRLTAWTQRPSHTEHGDSDSQRSTIPRMFRHN